MRDDRGTAVADSFYFDAGFADEDDLVVFDFTGPRWELVDHQPATKRRVRGMDPYNSVERPQRKQPWLRRERR
ncbi:MAG TPA: hypothetical protein VE046_17425 [Steroidobacteraceae bacterium]|nr:hypothetical protein [Steroidobacteraceae bacterium]